MGVALSAFEAAVTAFPADPDARNNLGQLLVRMGRVTEALPHLEAAAARRPREMDASGSTSRGHAGWAAIGTAPSGTIEPRRASSPMTT